MSTSNRLWLRMMRALPAPRAEVWKAMTDAKELGRWWGPKGFSVPELEFAPQEGESLRIAMQPPEGEVFHLEGEFREVDPPSLLSFTFRWDPPDPDDRETLVTLSVRDRGPRTEVELAQGEFATEERRALHEDGWSDSFEKLEELLAE
ncbi:MAG TPA: SRPBCC domain-containing protein [Solirubrobacterales bacterium]|nr:SRPBCC domain-containing protein [Solirubrobacterales bacterium]